MGFNYGKEKTLFDAQWLKLAKQYHEAGFDDEGIQAMRDFDWELFKRRRSYKNREQAFPSEVIDNNDEKSHSKLLGKFASLTSGFDENDFTGRYDWILAVDDPALSDKLAKLSCDDKELLTLLVFDGYTQAEIATLQGCTQQAISKKIRKMKLF